MVGMANTEPLAGRSGGVILLGIAPRSARIQGVQNVPEGVDRVFQAAVMIDPPLVLPLPEVHQVEGVSIIKVIIPWGLPHVYCLDGRYLAREGRYTGPMPARKLRQLLIERGIIHFESRVHPDATVDDLDPEQVLSLIHI